jgi:hypothetical protein
MLHVAIDVPCYAKDCGSSSWIAQHSMQKELDVVCQRLRLPLAIYKQHQIQLRQGVTFVRYSASIEHNFLGQPPSPCVGRFARSEYDAKEDVAVMLIRHLLHVTGGKYEISTSIMLVYWKIKFIRWSKRNCS